MAASAKGLEAYGVLLARVRKVPKVRPLPALTEGSYLDMPQPFLWNFVPLGKPFRIRKQFVGLPRFGAGVSNYG